MMDLQISMDSFARLQDIIREPSANLTAAFLLLAILTLLLLMAVVAALLVILRTRPASKTPVEAQVAGEGTALDGDESETTGSRVTHNLMVFALIVGGVALLWIALGISSSDRFVCDSCHADSPHAGSEALDPHLSVDCVVCHESGGAVQRATINLPVRVQHVILGSIAPAEAAEYGLPISSWGCEDCHETDIAATVVDVDRGVSMSHVEPVDSWRGVHGLPRP